MASRVIGVGCDDSTHPSVVAIVEDLKVVYVELADDAPVRCGSEHALAALVNVACDVAFEDFIQRSPVKQWGSVTYIPKVD